MILTGREAIEAILHVSSSRKSDGPQYVFYHDGERYGPFSTISHAAFVLAKLGWVEEIVKLADVIAS